MAIKPKLKNKKLFVTVKWGDMSNRTQTYYFDTPSEVEAFLLGAEQSSGWEEYVIKDMSRGILPCAE